MNIAARLFRCAKPAGFRKKVSNITNSLRYSIQAATTRGDDNLEVKIENEVERYPLVWLRDNCTCENCYHADTTSRIIDWGDFDVNVKAESVELQNDKVKIRWKDGHQSVYDSSWLKSRSFAKEKQQGYLNNVYRPPQVYWDKPDFRKILHYYDYNDVVSNNQAFHDWLKDLAVYGVVMIKNAPTNDESIVRKLASQIAFIKKTHYGEDYRITAKPGARNAAYLSGYLQLHTDLPYYNYKPGVILLHCLIQTKSNGGQNLLTDAFYVAEKLRAENKEVFDILTTTEVNWFDIGSEDGFKFHKIYRGPVIGLDSHGRIQYVTQSVHLRDSHFVVNLNNVKPWYQAMKIFVDTTNQHAAEFKTEPGSILAFDNVRMVHGRLAYEDTTENHRLLAGCYLDWDEIYSRLRVLRAELGVRWE